MNKNSSLFEQFRRNAVALISLVVALTSLGYNTWRNEASENNRNQRLVTIEILLMLGDVQQLTFDRHFGENIDGAAVLRQGWTKVLVIRDLAQATEGDLPKSAEALWETWGSDNIHLGSDAAAKDRIVAALEAVREDAHEVLQSLD